MAEPVADGTVCDDGLYCTVDDECTGGVCTSGTPRDCSGAGDQCTNGVCDEGLGACVAEPVADGTVCDDGLYCTQVDRCLGGLCIGSDDPCVDNGLYCDGVEYCEEDIGDYLCRSTGDPCDAALFCDELNDVCEVSDVTLAIPDAYGYSGTIAVELDNPLDYVSGMYLDVCDIDLRSWLQIDTVSCGTTARSSDFSCAVSDLGGGCVGVELTSSVAGVIEPGTGAVAVLNYTIDTNAPLTDYADVEPQNVSILDDGDPPVTLAVTPVPGRVRAVE